MDAIRDTQKIRYFLRSQLYSYKISKLNPEKEAEQRAARLADVLEVPETELEGYEDELRENTQFHDAFDSRWEELSSSDQISGSGTTSPIEATILYMICRAIEPDIVVQTGVMYGSFDAYILQALHKNGHGELHSIDLPNNESEFENGYLIPSYLRDRWTLHLGDVNDILPGLLDDIGSIDMFIHDSHHEKQQMIWEFRTGFKSLSRGGILASHDILKNDSFKTFCNQKAINWTRIVTTGVGQKP